MIEVEAEQHTEKDIHVIREARFLEMARQAAITFGFDPKKVIIADGTDTRNWKALVGGTNGSREWLSSYNGFVRKGF